MCFSRAAASLVAVFFAYAQVRADGSDPLRLIPPQADLCVAVERPAELVHFVQHHEFFKQVQAIGGVREFYNSTNFRRFSQLIGYFERELGLPYPELFDQLTGGGISFGLQFASPPAGLLVIQSRSEKALASFVAKGTKIIEQELARREAPGRLEKVKYHNIETFQIGKDFHAAVAGSALILSNKPETLRAALDLSLGKGKGGLARVADVSTARRLAGGDATAWMWLNLDKLHKAPQAKDFFALPRNEAALTVLFGGLLDVVSRSPFISASLALKGNDARLRFQLPSGLDRMPPALAVHAPRTGSAGPLPLLEPPGVLYSASFFLDLPKFWSERSKLFTEKQVKAMEEFDKNSGRFLAGTSLSQLLSQAGAHHRIIVVHEAKSGYAITPAQRIPAFAAVIELSEPDEFARRMEANLRTAALLATTVVKLKGFDEIHSGVKIIGYKFADDSKLPADVNNIRFNFSPCFATCGRYFLAASTLELGRELAALLKEERPEKVNEHAATVMKERFYASGGAELLAYYQDRLFTQMILQQAIPPDQARQEVQAVINLVKKLGILEVESAYQAKSHRLEFRLRSAFGQPANVAVDVRQKGRVQGP